MEIKEINLNDFSRSTQIYENCENLFINWKEARVSLFIKLLAIIPICFPFVLYYIYKKKKTRALAERNIQSITKDANLTSAGILKIHDILKGSPLAYLISEEKKRAADEKAQIEIQKTKAFLEKHFHEENTRSVYYLFCATQNPRLFHARLAENWHPLIEDTLSKEIPLSPLLKKIDYRKIEGFFKEGLAKELDAKRYHRGNLISQESALQKVLLDQVSDEVLHNGSIASFSTALRALMELNDSTLSEDEVKELLTYHIDEINPNTLKAIRNR